MANMSSRKRALSEITQPLSTPARYAPSTPHAIRALQQRSGAKTRSARSVRHASADAIRPDSIRGVLRQFAKVTAPVTKRRIFTPNNLSANKENYQPVDDNDPDNDSVLLRKPNLTFAIEESVEEDDSELLVAPTPSVLPDDDEQPTITFQNVTRIPLVRPLSERSDRRRSRVSLLHSDPLIGDGDQDQDADTTIMTERGRRALSEEATGRLSRYSFGSFRMSEFGSELEIRRESDKHQKTLDANLDDYSDFVTDGPIIGDETEDIRSRRSQSADGRDTFELSVMDNDTFRLEMPAAHSDEADLQLAHAQKPTNGNVVQESPVYQSRLSSFENHIVGAADNLEIGSRRQTLLETAAAKTEPSRRKRLKLTRHGVTIPCLPASFIKRTVYDSYEKQSKRRPTLGRDHIKALEQATEWFFEQVGEDLAAYSDHGRRKKRININDAVLLMRRQKLLARDGELQTLAQDWLTKDVLERLDLPDDV